jgi:26S proteasome regulatory subunit N8
MSDKEKPSNSSSSSSSADKEKKPADTKKDDKKDSKEKKEKEDAEKSDESLERSHYAMELVVVHPLVLLSVVDHYTRVAKDTNKRVVGVLLGEVYKGKADVTNSYAVPFEEDPKDPTIWYIDRQYHEDMFAMFKKVNAREKVLGWYSTGPKIRPADLEINEMFRAYTSDPILVIVDVNPKSDLEIPTQAYVSVESKPEESSESRRTFQHVLSEIGAYEAEEVGVEHLLRNIRDTTESSMSDQVRAKISSLKGLRNRLQDMAKYIDNVIDGKLPLNHQILYNLQDIFNLMPDLNVESLRQSFTINTNDNMMTIYIGSLVRSICALHDLINNKIANKTAEAEEGKTEAEKRAERKKAQEEEEEKKRKAAKEEEEKKAKKAGASKNKKDEF